MAANTNPISPIAPAISWPASVITAANTALDGTGTVGTLFTAGPNGDRIGRVNIIHIGTNVATVLRIFVNNGSTNTVAANNQLLGEITMPSNTLSQVASSIPQILNLNVFLKPGYKLIYTLGTAVAAGHALTVPDAGDY